VRPRYPETFSAWATFELKPDHAAGRIQTRKRERSGVIAAACDQRFGDLRHVTAPGNRSEGPASGEPLLNDLGDGEAGQCGAGDSGYFRRGCFPRLPADKTSKKAGIVFDSFDVFFRVSRAQDFQADDGSATIQSYQQISGPRVADDVIRLR